jgi:hypothetical protein
LSEYVVAQAAVLIVPTLDGFQAKLEKELRQIQRKALEIQVKADTTRMVAQVEAAKKYVESQEINLKINELGITKQITEIRHKYEDLQREMKKGLFLDLKITGMSLLPQLAYGLAAANASMVQLAQSAALLPGVLSGVLSSVGALATGLGGVKDAFKEYGDAQKNAAQEGLKARNAALNVNNAYRDLNQTVKDAKRSLEDLNAQLRDAPLDEADAIIRVQEARAEAADKAQKSGLQQQKDALNILKAENDLADTRMRNSRLLEDVATANAKGVAGNAAVVDATDRLSKAMDDAGTKATKLSDSLTQLSPNAQEFVRIITGMQGQFDSFRNSVQDRLFDGLGAEVAQLGQTGLPVLQRGFSAIAGELNGNLKTAIASLQTTSNVGFIERILGNTADAQGKIDSALNPLIDALLRLSSAGSDFLPRLADGLSDVLTRFDAFIVRAEGDGSLEKWMNTGIDALKDLGNSIINIGSMLSSLNDAFTAGGGNSLLGSLEQATTKLAEMMSSADGQNKLIKFFTEAREQLAKWRPLLDALPGVLVNLSNTASSLADIFLPFLTSAAQALREFPGLVTAVFYAFVLWKNIIPVAKSVYGMVDALSGSLDGLKTRLTNHSGAQGHIGKFVTTMGNAKTMVGELAKSLGPTLLLTAVTTAATYIGTRLAQAHLDAEAAARRQKEELNDLVTSLDAVTGAAGKATNAVIGGNLRDGVNAATGQSFGNLTELLADPNAAIEATKRGDLGSALSQIKGGAITPADVAAIDGGKWWDGFGKYLESEGVSQQTVADAFNGDPAAVKKFTDAQNKSRRGRNLNLPQGASDALDSILPGEADAFPSLKDLQGRLPNDGARRAATAGVLSENARNVTQGGAAQRQANAQDFGSVRLPDGSPLAQFGVIEQPAINAGGGAMITSSKPVEGSALAEQLRSDGVTFENFDDGKFRVVLSPDAANKYFERYAAGGLISGPGSGTSDSILARLSRGEFVVNAASTQKHLPLLEKLNGGGLPAFAPGGPVPLKPPPVVPTVPDIAPPSSNSMTAPKAPYVAPTEAQSQPNAFSRFFETANNALWDVTDTVGDFFKGATGIGETPEGYKETRTATVSTDKGIMTKPKQNDLSALDTAYSPLTKPGAGSFPSFVEQVAQNVAGGSLSKAPFPSLDSAPATPVTPSVPAKPPVVAASAPAKPSAPPFVYGSALPQAPARGNDIFSPSGAVNPVSALPAMLATPVAGPMLSQQLSNYSMPVGSSISYGQGGFPDWVYQTGKRFGMLASTYAGHQEGSGANKGIDWVPEGLAWNTPEGAARMTEYAKYLASLGTMEQIIYQNPFTKETVGVYNGKLVGPGTDQPQYYNADWATHQNHIHTRTSLAIPTPEQLISLGGSPSNMPLAATPTGVGLPQISYATGASPGLPGMGAGGIDLNAVVQNYVKSVQENWGSILQNLVKNAGSIAMNFLGSFFGIDLSPIMGIANAISGDLSNVEDLFKPGDAADAALPADASVAQALQSAEFNSLPPDLQRLYESRVEAEGDNGQAAALLQQLLGVAQQYGAGSPSGYDPAGGAEQWRPTVRRILQTHAAKYGITNLQAWEDALVRQIQSESNGNPSADNPTDTNGKGGTQHVSGLLQFLPETFAANNITGGDYLDPEAQIAAAISYVANKYGMDASGAPNQIGRGVGYAHGGKVRGKGTGMSDSILARVSNGEYIVKASAAQKNMGLLNAINSGVPGFAEGGLIPPVNNPPVVPPPPVTTPPPPPAPVPPAPMGPTAGAEAGQPTAPAPTTAVTGPGEAENNALSQVGSALSGIGASIGGATGAEAPAGASPTSDPRSVLPAAPQNLDHNLPAVSKGIQAAGSAISSAVSTAMSVGSMGAGGAGAVGGGAASGAASSAVAGFINAGTGAATGAVNILSSLLVGTLSRGGTGGAYGTPLVPQQQSQYAGPSVVNNWNGGVHTSNNEEFYKIQQRRELQNASPMLPRR